MWSFFSRDPAKDFHYDIGEKVTGLEEKSIWSLFKGKKKGSGEPVSIFVFDVKGSSESQVQLAKAAFKRIKTLRHPNILTFVDGVETDKVIYIATEPVVPLENYLQENQSLGNQNELAISWGLHQIVKGLSFLVNDCHLIHNNVCMSSVFVDPAGEWKLAGVDYIYSSQGQDSVPPVKILPVLEKYDPPEKSELRRGIRGEPWSSDMWGLGCLIWEVFNGPLPRTESLKSFGKIPKILVPNYCELVSANPRSRPNPAKFIESCRSSKGFMNNSFVNTMLFLEEIQIKDQSEKMKFFNDLTLSLDSFPQQFCQHKILPQLLRAFEFGDAGSSVLAPLFKLGKLLSMEEYQKKIVPCVVKLFSSPDRSTRVKLLQQVESFIDFLQPATVNDQIFPHVSQGFMDTNPIVRESTIKAMLSMAPKLNYKNLNEELMKHFARLQAKDDQGGIRTNTTVCLGKIACYLNPQIRQKIITSAFLRALKDPFPPVRQSGILGMAATQNFYMLKEIANRLLPALCAMTLDPDKGVRDQAFKAVKGFLSKLEKVSENPDLTAEMEKDVLTGGVPAGGAASWAGWAVTGMSSLTSKIYSKATKAKPAKDASNSSHIGELKSNPKPSTTTPPGEQPLSTSNTEVTDYKEDDVDEGWDDNDWGDIECSPLSSPVVTSTTDNDGWDNDEEDWGSLEDTTTQQSSSHSKSLDLRSKNKKSPSPDPQWGSGFGDDVDFESTEDTGLPPASSYNWGGETEVEQDDDFFSSVMELPKKQKPKSSFNNPSSVSSGKNTRVSPAKTVTKSSQQTNKSSSQVSVSEGWGSEISGWGEDDNWDSFDTSSSATKTKSSSQIKSSAADNTGWNDSGWGDSGWSDTTDKSDIARQKKEEREAKRIQRQKEMQEKREAKKGSGALKLGAKKFAMD
ncbi:hypothetical protein KUTeg_013382 [Tegillarca granosa]|uniref:N-terminal kinase-like protein n=1 Tax=Tegillarca granosa TaxID=220873 RepID=A0ABQ9ETJ2_TEGGR|nr:hypothetical protein KUTeg_013382 [Tegillarca granosa]